MKESKDGVTNTVDKKLDEIMGQIQSIKAYFVTRDTAQMLVSREMMKKCLRQEFSSLFYYRLQ
jgi:hypothetical protein